MTKSILKPFAVGLVCVALVVVPARADILRLRDGRMFTGNFLGATRTEIWFQVDTPGQIVGASAYPVTQVESVTFGPAKQADAGVAVTSEPPQSHPPALPSRRP